MVNSSHANDSMPLSNSLSQRKGVMWPHPLEEVDMITLAKTLEKLLQTEETSTIKSENYTKMTFKESQR